MGDKLGLRTLISQLPRPHGRCIRGAITDENLRKWISHIVGYGKHNFDRDEAKPIFNSYPQVYFAASVLWQILTSWVNNLEEY